MRKALRINIIFQSLNKVTRNVLRDFGEIENLQVSPNSIDKFVSRTENKIYTSLLEDLTKSRPEWGMKLNPFEKSIKDKYYWIVDVLNGQFNFSHALPYFAISVSVEFNNEILSTVILDPLRDELFFAEKGKGSFLNDRRIRVSRRNSLNSNVFCIYDDRKINFGSTMSDFTIHGDKRRRDNYRNRHKGVKLTSGKPAYLDKRQPAYWSYWILW